MHVCMYVYMYVCLVVNITPLTCYIIISLGVTSSNRRVMLCKKVYFEGHTLLIISLCDIQMDCVVSWEQKRPSHVGVTGTLTAV